MPQPDPLSEFKTLGRRDQRRPCKVAEALKNVPDKERKRVLAALEHSDDEIRRGVKLWLAERDIAPPSVAALGHHRSKACRCHG